MPTTENDPGTRWEREHFTRLEQEVILQMLQDVYLRKGIVI